MMVFKPNRPVLKEISTLVRNEKYAQVLGIPGRKEIPWCKYGGLARRI